MGVGLGGRKDSKGKEPDREMTGQGSRDDKRTDRSLACPLVEGVESLTMNGIRGIERGEPNRVLLNPTIG
jgi:hypothetical protein